MRLSCLVSCASLSLYICWLGEGCIPVGVCPFCYFWWLSGSRWAGVSEGAFRLFPVGVANARDYGSFQPEEIY